MTHFPFLFTLAAIGISETVYLMRKRMAHERPACILGEECHKVLESKYNNILGIHNDILGVAFYLIIALITAFLVIEVPPLDFWNSIAKILILVGITFSFIALYLQWRVIRAWCFWCVASSATVFIMAIIIFMVQ